MALSPCWEFSYGGECWANVACRKCPPSEGTRGLGTLARRLVPVLTFVFVLSLVLAGVLRSPAGHGGGSVSAGSERSAKGGWVAQLTGISDVVGAIPGVPAAGSPGSDTIATRPLGASAGTASGHAARLLQADVLVVAQKGLPSGLAAAIRHLRGVVAAVPVDAGRIKVNGVYVNVLGVDPRAFRPFAAKPTADSATLWRNLSSGGIAVSYTMGHQDKMSLSRPVRVIGARAMTLPVAGFGTVGIGGVDAVVSLKVARSLGLPQANAVVVSAPHARLDRLMTRIKKAAPAQAAVAALVTQVIVGRTEVTTSAAAGAAGVAASGGLGLTTAELTRFLAAAESRVGLPYVWGGDGPFSFDCSGLVQWSLRQAGVVMPRVAADQARTGPLIPLSDLRPGDLLFYHTDPTAPTYISHVAIYLGNGLMEQAPQPGMNVQIVHADFGAGFAGAIEIYPRVAAGVAGSLAG
jgi:cell wall-associated NlpC family hydrolase